MDADVAVLENGYYRVLTRMPDPPPSVAIVIPTRDRAALLRICVESVLGQTRYPDYRIVLVDNGSEEPAALQLLAELSRRLHSRAQDAEDVIERRLGRAAGEIRMWGEYDYVLVNEDYDTAYSQLGHIYHAERLRRARNPWLRGFVGDLLEE